MVSMGIGGPVGMSADFRARLAGHLADQVLATATKYDIPVCETLLDNGDAVADQLVRFSEAQGIDLIVMATHGRGAAGRLFLGSVAHRLVQTSHKPCLLVRGPTEGPRLNGRAVFSRILVPLNGSAEAEAILEQVHDLAGPDTTEILVLRITPPPLLVEPAFGSVPVIPPATVIPEFPELTREYVEGVAAALRAGGLRARGLALEEPATAATILKVAQTEGADLIALSGSTRGPLDRFLLGSVIDHVVQASPVPVLVRRLTAAPSKSMAAVPAPAAF
jgi:nucleotide-binding universal stress UspA family protein